MTEPPKRDRRAYYNQTSSAVIRRADIDSVSRIHVPENVERREFSGPCPRCETNAWTSCKHRRIEQLSKVSAS